MYKYLNLPVSLFVATLLFSVPSVATAKTQSNVKLIPKAFMGEWVGITQNKKKPNKATIRSLCNHSYDYEDGYFLTFNPNRKDMTTVVFLEDVYNEKPVSYTKYSPNHIIGKSLITSDYDESDKPNYDKFNYKVVNDQLTVVNSMGTFYLSRCS